MTFGERLRMLRRERGMSQEELGQRAGVSARVIGYYEADDRFPKNHQILIDLARAFQVSLDYLLDNPVRQETLCPTRFCYMKTMNSEQRAAVNKYISYLRWLQQQEEEEQATDDLLDTLPELPEHLSKDLQSILLNPQDAL